MSPSPRRLPSGRAPRGGWGSRPVLAREAMLALALALGLGPGCRHAPALRAEDPTAVKTTVSGPTPEVPFAPTSDPLGSGALPPPGPRTAPLRADGPTREVFQRALASAQRGDRATAQRDLQGLLDRTPTLDYAWTNLGILYERDGRLADAEAAYKHALQARIDQADAWDLLTRLYCRTGRAAAMEPVLRARVQQLPAALGLRNALVYLLAAGERLDEAAEEAKKVLKADERNVRAMQLLARVYFRQGKLELARMVLDNARAVDPADAGTYNELGLVQLGLGNRALALESFQKAVALEHEYAEAENNEGTLLNEAQDYDGAARVLERAVQAAPDFAAARLNLGNAYRGQQDIGRALAQYQEVLRLAPSLVDTYFNLAVLHLDSEVPHLDTLARLKTALTYFATYRAKGGADERTEQYVKDAHRAIEKEERRLDRERKAQLKKAAKPASPAADPGSAKLPPKATGTKP